ncbi:MAG: formate dehydrogenase [SAR202 cluster bacterium]|nr:formate dehydrogenase [SAR202 cluster bacterium]
MTVANTSNEALRERIQKAITHQKRPTVTVLSSLLAVQDEIGYIPDVAIEEVAKFTDTTLNDVWGVASFYKNFRFTPPSAHTVEVCWGPTCHLVGATKVMTELMGHLGLKDEGDTADKKLTLRFNTCLGACSQAPVISVDHHLWGKVTPERACKLADKARESGPKHH